MSYEVVLCDSFKRAVKYLEKRYPSVKDDVRNAIRRVLETPDAGDVIPGGHGVRKLRVANSDQRKGKSGGYRVLYYLASNPRHIIFCC